MRIKIVEPAYDAIGSPKDPIGISLYEVSLVLICSAVINKSVRVVFEILINLGVGNVAKSVQSYKSTSS